MADFMQYALDFMALYGLIAVFVLLVLDGAALLPAVPGEVVLIIAVQQYAQDMTGLLTVYGIAVSAAMVGSLIVYGLGRGASGRKGKPRRKVLGMSPKKQEKLQRTFERPAGQSLVLFLRLFPLTRVLVSLPAGIARMPFKRFFALSMVGMMVFYAGFLWLTYEFRQPDSAVANTATSLQAAAYNSPAWTFIETNWIVTGALVVLVGVFLSVRASFRMARDHEETSGSMLGMVSNLVLFWGGIATLVGLWLDPELVYGLIAVGGVDVHTLSLGAPYEPFSLVAGAAVVALLLSRIVAAIRRAAKVKNRERAAAEAARPVQFEAVPKPDAAPPPTATRASEKAPEDVPDETQESAGDAAPQ